MRGKISLFAAELFPHLLEHFGEVEALKALKYEIEQMIQDILDHDRIFEEDPVVYYETQVGEPEYDEDPF